MCARNIFLLGAEECKKDRTGVGGGKLDLNAKLLLSFFVCSLIRTKWVYEKCETSHCRQKVWLIDTTRGDICSHSRGGGGDRDQEFRRRLHVDLHVCGETIFSWFGREEVDYGAGWAFSARVENWCVAAGLRLAQMHVHVHIFVKWELQSML